MRYYRTEYAAKVAAVRAGLPCDLEPGQCCDRAERRRCVCLFSWACVEHGDTCVGSHD